MTIDRDIPHHIECSHFEVFVVLIVRMAEAHEPPRIDGIYFILVTVAMDCKLCMPH
jgi:hypothetical protein